MGKLGYYKFMKNTTLHIADSYFYERDVSLSSNTHIAVSNTLSGFSIGWAIYNFNPKYIICELKNLGTPSDENGVQYDFMKWDLP
jgi:hypothetical protein